jgi:hypothetical protein
MSESDTPMRRLAPPSGGLQRLQARREAKQRRGTPWVPFAAGCAAAILLLAVFVPAQQLDMPWIGGRLVGARSEGTSLRLLGGHQATSLPTNDPGVRFYLVEGREGG